MNRSVRAVWERCIGRGIHGVNRYLLAVCVLAVAACAPEPLEFPDWTIPVPEATRIVEYGAVPVEARTERIELVEDLVIGGGRLDDLDYAFYRATDIEVSNDSRIFVHDTGNHRIQAFDSNGRYLRTFSREGQGPGEMKGGGGRGLSRAGDRRLRNTEF